jgi:uncharacterized membrane protein
METLEQRVKVTSSPVGHKGNFGQFSYWIAALVVTAFYLATTIYLASHRLFWNDEVLTVVVSRLPHWTTIWTALSRAVDSQPPLYYLIVRFSESLFGHSEVAARLPSVLAMASAMLITFDCARRLTDGLHGLLALFVLACSMLPYYGYEARPYALCVMLSAVSFWIWVHSNNNKVLPTILFGFVMFLGVAIHYYFVLTLVPYALWEGSRWKPWELPSRKLIAGTVGILVPAIIQAPVILSFGRQFGHNFMGHPTFWVLGKTFSDFFPNGLLLLALTVVCIALLSPEYTVAATGAAASAEVLGWLFFAIPLAGFVVSWKTNAFFPRYFIAALPGVAVAFSCCIWRHVRRRSLASAAIVGLLALWAFANQLQVVKHPESVDRAGSQGATRRYLSLENTVHRSDIRHIVFFDALPYLEARYYSRYPEQCVLFLLGPDEEIDAHATRVLFNLDKYYPMQFWTLDDLKERARDTMLIGPTPNTLKAMEEAGFELEVSVSEPWKVAYLR